MIDSELELAELSMMGHGAARFSLLRMCSERYTTPISGNGHRVYVSFK